MTLDEANMRIDRILPAMPGWCTPEKGKRLARLAYEKRARVCVELGVFGGRSLICIGFGLAASGDGWVDGIDPYAVSAALEGRNDKENDEWWSKIDYEKTYQDAVDVVRQNGLLQYVNLIRDTSLRAVSKYEDGTIELLHQDSNHSEEISCAEVHVYAPKMAPGGYWISDDINWQTIQASLALLTRSGFKVVETHETWMIFQKEAA